MERSVTERNVLLHQQTATGEETLRIISDYPIALAAADDAYEVYAGFLAREEVDQTDMVEGFAIPHRKTDAVKRATVIVFKNDRKLAWPSLDDESVDIAMALLVPGQEAGTKHLRLLSKTAVLLMDDGFKKLLCEGDDATFVADAINTELER